ncbi:two-component sensor histidine kinase [Actinoplanes philippinensis]|uniref:sensor histidine kinase n=1 Tax=Actinoplanes philippinensis TaxID=35752 RepID=UPI000B893138|nr:ATP-binding protein [Actinoplanes philippinensis]GIE78970.1 two-component sensor histidine kinase [Actinoplanes philippinensis]
MLAPSRRVLLIGGLAFLAGVAAPTLLRLLYSWLRLLGLVICGPAEERGDICRAIAGNQSWQVLLALLVTLAGLLLIARVGVRWALDPFRRLVPAIASVGPQNLGYRINAGAGREEITELSRAIDAMMDRIVTGYEAQRHFAANAAHELRTPLAVQRTLIEVGLGRATTPDKLELLTAQLLATNERNERLIEGLLVLSECDRGLAARVPVRLDTVVGTVLDDYEARAAEAGVTITRRLAERTVRGERVLLERLVNNLVQNAIKYNRAGGTITVEVGARPALAIANTGDDVPPDAVVGLFEPFRRLSGTRIDHSGGAGLGLAIVRAITRAHDGVISAHSTGKDGLRVEVSFGDSTE